MPVYCVPATVLMFKCVYTTPHTQIPQLRCSSHVCNFSSVFTNPMAVLEQVARALKPGGQFHFLEAKADNLNRILPLLHNIGCTAQVR